MHKFEPKLQRKFSAGSVFCSAGQRGPQLWKRMWLAIIFASICLCLNTFFPASLVLFDLASALSFVDGLGTSLAFFAFCRTPLRAPFSAPRWGVEVLLHRYFAASSCRTLDPNQARCGRANGMKRGGIRRKSTEHES